MDIFEANELAKELANYRNVELRRVPGSGDDPEYEVWFKDWNLGFTHASALNRFMDAIDQEREYRNRRKNGR